MGQACGDGSKEVRQYCTNFRCLFRKTCQKAQEPLEGEQVVLFRSMQDDIDCPDYDTMLTKYELTDHTNEYLERRYKKYGIVKKRVI